MTNGTSFDVSLSQAVTIGDLINAIQKAAGGQVKVSINSANPYGLLVTQASSVAQNSSSVFAILPLNGSSVSQNLGIQHLTITAPSSTSYAAGDLGIQGSDVESTGTITGRSLSGDSLAQHVFIQNASITAGVTGTASGITGSAIVGQSGQPGSVGLLLSNGTGSLNLQGTLSIAGPTTLQTLTSVLQGTTPLSNVASTSLSGKAQLNLPLGLQTSPPLTGYSLPNGATIVVNWTNTTPLTVSVSPSLPISAISMSGVMQGLAQIESFIQTQIASAAAFNQTINGLGMSLNSIVNPVASFGTLIQNLAVNPPTTIEGLINQFNGTLGAGALSASYTGSSNLLQLQLNYKFFQTQNISLNFNATGLGQILDTSASDPISLTVSGSVLAGLDINFSQGTPRFSVLDSSQIAKGSGTQVQIGAQILSTGVGFNATVGPLGLYISGGSIYLDNGTHAANNPATWTLGLQPSSTNGARRLARRAAS